MVTRVVGAVVALTVMRVLVFVYKVSMLRECKSEGNAGGGIVWARAGCEYMGCTSGSGVVSSADDVLEMSVVRAVRDVGEVCEMCMCLARGGVGVVGVV